MAEQRQARNRQVMEWITEESALAGGMGVWSTGVIVSPADCEIPLARALRLEEQWLQIGGATPNDGASPHASVLLALLSVPNLLHEEIVKRL